MEDKIPTKYEFSLMVKHDLTFAQLCEVRYFSKDLIIPLTLDRACELHAKGKLRPLQEERKDKLRHIEDIAEKAQDVKLSRRDSDDDVAKILKQHLDEGDKSKIRALLTSCKCKEGQIDNLIFDMDNPDINPGIIRMRAGNMMRNALRRKIL
jgi:hypothetical protein